MPPRNVPAMQQRMNQVDPKNQTPFPDYKPWNDRGREILKKGKRQSHDNHPEDGPPESIDHIMEMLNINLQERIKNQKRGKNTPPRIDIRDREQKMRGLFGGKE